MSATSQHGEWLSLVEVSGPFLTLPVLSRAFPQGLEPTDPDLRADLRAAYAEVCDDISLAQRWVRWVLGQLLGLGAEVLVEGAAIGPGLRHRVPEHGVDLRPDLVVLDPDDRSGTGTARPRLLVCEWPWGSVLDERPPNDRWSATPIDRMAELCRAAGVRLGLVTNGEVWVLLHAPAGEAVGSATWDAALWLDERVTLDAFTTLLGARRFFSVPETETLAALLDESANAEAEVTDQLGRQVLAAVELLVDAISRANRDRHGVILAAIDPTEVYEAAVTVMMRLVFLLSAEERGLFALGDPLYDTTYAISTLRAQLEEESNRYGEDTLAQRSTAWHRLLATFRLVYAGATHEDLRLPAYGSSLFDPDRFAWLEGRQPGQPWREAQSSPLRIDDRAVLHILGALQVLRFTVRGGTKDARRLSFRALDVEQIGHVYEGLLDHTAVVVSEVAVRLGGKLTPELALADIEAHADHGIDALVTWLSEKCGSSEKALAKLCSALPDPDDLSRLVSACDNDHALADRVAPYLALARKDLAGLPQVYLPDSFVVTTSGDRRSSGTYYTPRSLAEEMVTHALQPLVYAPGPAEGARREGWRLRSGAELLELRVCDLAMGSGAFLVAACRYLAARLVEAWEAEGLGAGDLLALPGGHSVVLPSEEADREVLARRLIADRCLYGVDRNPMAVEMAKLSLWLVTLAKDRPFTFVDHALRRGDSLLGITTLDQLTYFHLDVEAGRKLHEGRLFDPFDVIAPLVDIALAKRRELESFPVIDVTDAQRKADLFAESRQCLQSLGVIADVVVGAALSTATGNANAHLIRLLSLAEDVRAALDPDRPESDRALRLGDLEQRAEYWLDEGRPPMSPDRHCFHWPLEFPEVFADDRPGFDAIIGNPPFLGGKRISGPFGNTYREYLVAHVADARTGNADLVTYFFLRGAHVSCDGGIVALLATNTIAQGDTREVGLDWLTGHGWSIPRAFKSRPWPGDANLEVAQVWLRHGPWEGQATLDGRSVKAITPALDPCSRASGVARRLNANARQSFQGSNLNGVGFVLDPDEAELLVARDPRNANVLCPYLNGEDLNSRPDCSPSRWVINFFDWPLERAERYPECLAIVRLRVKPHRDGLPDYKRRVRDTWWRFEHVAPALYAAVAGMDRVLVLTLVSKVVLPVLVPNSSVFAHKLAVFAYNDYFHFGLLSSSFHYHWAIANGSTLETRTNYSPTDCFETFPQPVLTDEVGKAGGALDNHRRQLMLDRWEGLTKTYNRVHNAKEEAADIIELRRLHVELDHAVAAAYGWSDIDLDHGHWETRQGTRFTIGPEARIEVLDRLLELNHERHAGEVASGARPTGKRFSSRKAPNATLFEEVPAT